MQNDGARSMHGCQSRARSLPVVIVKAEHPHSNSRQHYFSINHGSIESSSSALFQTIERSRKGYTTQHSEVLVHQSISIIVGLHLFACLGSGGTATRAESSCLLPRRPHSPTPWRGTEERREQSQSASTARFLHPFVFTA